MKIHSRFPLLGSHPSTINYKCKPSNTFYCFSEKANGPKCIPRAAVHSVLHKASANIPINYLALVLCSDESQAESFSKAPFTDPFCFECRLKQSVGSLVILLYSPWCVLAFLSSPKSGGKIYFLCKKPPKNRKQNQTTQVWCLGAACMHYHGWSFICGANAGNVRTNQFSDSIRGRAKLGCSVPCPILILHKYCLYLQFHSYIPAVLPIQRLLSHTSRLRLLQSFLQPCADREAQL